MKTMIAVATNSAFSVGSSSIRAKTPKPIRKVMKKTAAARPRPRKMSPGAKPAPAPGGGAGAGGWDHAAGRRRPAPGGAP